MRLKLPVEPRPDQWNLINHKKRFGVSLRHRRNGKTVAIITKLIKRALANNLQSPRYGYMAPYLKQAREIAWDYLVHYTSIFPDVRWNKTELSATFMGDRKISLMGADNADSHRGKYLDGIGIDEFDDIDYIVWTEIVLPALADRNGWADILGTPKGRANLYAILEMAKKSDELWYWEVIKASESGVLSPEQMSLLRANMTEMAWRQEMEMDFDAYADGLINIAWFKFYKGQPPEPIVYRTWSWDTANKKGEKNDYSVGQLWGRSAAGRDYLLKMVRGKYEYPELKRLVRQCFLSSPSHEVLIEDAASGQQLIQEFKADTKLPIIAMKPSSSDRNVGMPKHKEERVLAVSTRIESGLVWLPADDQTVESLLVECSAFPSKNVHDDTIDPLTQYLIRRYNVEGRGKARNIRLGGL